MVTSNGSPAYFFPGQGAQHLGMAIDLAAAYPEARAVFARGSEVLGRDVLEVCRSGPEEVLNSTRISQPAIFLHSMAVLEILAKELGAPGGHGRGLPAFAAAGLSLGEYSALVFAGSLEFEDALAIVKLRGEFMQKACDAEKGSMASIIGLPAAKVEEVVETSRKDGLRAGVANYNSPDQTVVSGAAADLEELVKRLEAAGARRAIRLKVAGAYHSPLMAPATRELEPYLREVRIRPPRVPFYSNCTGAEASNPEEIRTNLVRQVESPVRWEQIVRGLVGLGLRSAVEAGPGRVVQGLVRGVARDLEMVSAGTLEGILKLREDGVAAA
jgi:[acyl-carrier-protein] S-malonyltransferase